jgi:hypothetical protein
VATAAESYLNAIKAHATKQSGHPGYRDEWKPSEGAPGNPLATGELR